MIGDQTSELQGYKHPDYAKSLSDFGMPRYLPGCGGSILVRSIPHVHTSQDAMGCYPLFSCLDWSQLPTDIEDLRTQLISLAIVADPFGDYGIDLLHSCFDKVTLFKEHYIVRLAAPPSSFVSKHHRYYARRALQDVQVVKRNDLQQFVNEWDELYKCLVRKHGLSGVKAFNKTSFAKQMAIPGMVAFAAVHQGSTVAAQLWYIQGEVAYSHLAASNQHGYELGASYALYWFAIEYFLDDAKVRWLDLGAGAGASGESEGGLSAFKRDWSTETKPVYFCGRVLDRAKYATIVQALGLSETHYFPAYRQGEFE